MSGKIGCWQPKYILSPAVVRSLAEIEAAKALVEYTPLTPVVENELRNRVRIRSTHFSTYIEGNRLTLSEAAAVIQGAKINCPGRERDVAEVLNYWNALLRVEQWTAKKVSLTEDLICRLHALVEKGLRAKPTPYRDGQNIIRDSASGAIVYMPPKPKTCLC